MTCQVTLRYSDGIMRSMPVTPDETVLEAADSHGVPIVSECHSGICGTCVGRCAQGDFSMGHVAGLSTQEKEQRRILTCQTRVQSDCTIDVDYPFAGNSARLVSGVAGIVDVKRLSANTVLLKLDVYSFAEPLTFKSGQFAQLKVPGTNAWRSYSFVGAPGNDTELEFLIRLQPGGMMSEFLMSSAASGGEIEIRGSKGAFYLRNLKRPILLIAGGTGLSGVLSMAEHLAGEAYPAPVRLLYGVTEQDDLVLADRLDALAQRRPGFTWEPIVRRASADWNGRTGLVTDLLDKSALQDTKPDIYLCGPTAMVEATHSWLDQNGLSDIELYFEKFTPSGSGATTTPLPKPDIDMHRIRDQGRGTAVVIGGSIAGMATAKVLLEKYERVIVLEKDPHHRRMEGRPGAAQGWHLHHLLIAGQRQLETVFPSIIDDMVEAGAFRVDMGEQYRLMLAGDWKKAVRSGIEIICAGRPLLEWCIRRRLDDESRIDFRYGHDVTDLILDPSDRSIRGVIVRRDGRLDVTAAEFVVDASGKNTSAPAMLGQLGVTAPEVEEDCLNCFYSTMQHKVPANRAWQDKVMVICYAHRPHQQYYAAQYYTDTTRTVLSTSLVGYNCYEPPRNADEFREFARRMPSQVIGEELDGLEPHTEVFNFRYPEMRRYHYERLDDLPTGLIAIGDAFCSADPVSGAGMTKALLELNELRDLLHSGDPGSPAFVKTYYARVAKIADRVWFVIREQNLRYPWIKDVEAKRPFYFRFHNWYVDRVIELLHDDPAVYRRYLSVTHFISPPSVLMRPSVMLKVLRRWVRSRISSQPTMIEKNFGAHRIVPGPAINQITGRREI